MVVNINDPLLYSGGYVDDVMTPLSTFSDLRNFQTNKMFVNLKVIVNNDGIPVTFMFVGPTKNRFNWIITEFSVFPTYGDLTATTSNIVTTLGTRSKAFYVGLEATVQVGDETGGIEKYVVTEVNNGIPTWSIENIILYITGNDVNE